MNFSAIEWMAAIIAIIALIKIFVILIKPKAWLPVIEFFYSKPNITMIVSAILAAITFRYLFMELTMVQIFATILFTSLLAMVTISVYSKEVISIAKKMLKDRKFLSRAWLSIIIWVILAILVLKEIFF
ncbi:MAG: hypothetical protein Q7R52_03760 [archaeon]|nr:hypothetical protein [archaeon]